MKKSEIQLVQLYSLLSMYIVGLPRYDLCITKEYYDIIIGRGYDYDTLIDMLSNFINL